MKLCYSSYMKPHTLNMWNLKNLLCCWCCDKIHNNVWGTHLGDFFPARNFSYIRVLKNRYSIEKYIIFGWFELEFAQISCLRKVQLNKLNFFPIVVFAQEILAEKRDSVVPFASLYHFVICSRWLRKLQRISRQIRRLNNLRFKVHFWN